LRAGHGVGDQEPECPAVVLRRAGIAVAGEVENVKGGGSRERFLPLHRRVPFPAPRSQDVHVQHPSLAWSPGGLGYPSAGESVQQARFTPVRAADEGDFGKRWTEGNVGPRKGADEPGFCGQASFFWRTRSVTSSGGRPSVTHSAVMATSRTSSRLGRSNMMSVIISSRIARRPRAPVPRLIAFCAMAVRASFSIVRRASSSSK